MDYKSRIGMGPGLMSAPSGGSAMAQNGTVGANFGTAFQVGGNATGPALVLIGILTLLVLDYVWTRGQQGGR